MELLSNAVFLSLVGCGKKEVLVEEYFQHTQILSAKTTTGKMKDAIMPVSRWPVCLLLALALAAGYTRPGVGTARIVGPGAVSVGDNATFTCLYTPKDTEKIFNVRWLPGDRTVELLLKPVNETYCSVLRLDPSLYNYSMQYACDLARNRFTFTVVGVTSEDLYESNTWCCEVSGRYAQTGIHCDVMMPPVRTFSLPIMIFDLVTSGSRTNEVAKAGGTTTVTAASATVAMCGCLLSAVVSYVQL